MVSSMVNSDDGTSETRLDVIEIYARRFYWFRPRCCDLRQGVQAYEQVSWSRQEVQVLPMDGDAGRLPRGSHNDRSDSESNFDVKLLEETEEALDRLDSCRAGSALPAGVSFGGV